MYCRNCGAKLKDGAKFCAECGESIDGSFSNEQSRGVRVKVTPRQMDDYEQIRYVEQAYKKKKSHWFLWLVILLAAAALAFLYYSPMTRYLYVYSKIQLQSDKPITEQEKREITAIFEGTYLYRNEDGKYYVTDIESGMEFALSDYQDTVSDDNDEIEFSFETFGNFAWIELQAIKSNDRVTVSYFKASLMERVRFISRYYYW